MFFLFGIIRRGYNENDDNLMEAYARIDAYSQGRLQGEPLDMSARNMGKNDLWIAATAYVAMLNW